MLRHPQRLFNKKLLNILPFRNNQERNALLKSLSFQWMFIFTFNESFWTNRDVIILYILTFVVLIFIIFYYRTRTLRRLNKILREKENTRQELSQQREELISKNQSITDSIHYAKRIQQALLPSERHFKTLIPDSFILYMPKDIVSGDFYWINSWNDKIYVAAIDCTGHGVPGAFMSFIGYELFRNITIGEKIEDPAEILNSLNRRLISTLGKNEESPDLHDGMDISLCVFNKRTRTMEYAGAFNPLYIIRNNKLEEIKADRYTVGLVNDPEMSFSKHIISLEDVEMIYLFTDGYTDQFGGPEGKKYKFRRFRHLLLTIHKFSVHKQKLFLHDSIEKWRGNLEQVDDILVIGVNPRCLFE